MSAENDVSRRGFIAGAVAAAGGLALLAKQGGALASTGSAHAGQGAAGLGAQDAGLDGEVASVDRLSSVEPQLFLFDLDHAVACLNVAASANFTCPTRAITGDSVRLAHEVFASGNAPEVVAGASSYADFILLSGTAAEHGYRVLEESAQGPLVSWKLARWRRPTSSG